MPKKFIVYFSVQILIFLMLVSLLSSVKIKGIRLWTILNPNVVLEGGQSKLMFNDFENFQIQDNTIFVIGSSHAYRGYDPRVFKSQGIDLFNMGTSAQNMKDSYTLIKTYKAKIHYLIIDIYSWVLQDLREESTSILIQNVPNTKTACRIFKNNITINSFNNLFARIFDLNHQMAKHNEKYIYNGYVENNNKYVIDPTFEYQFFVPGENLNYLDSILQFASKNAIKVCVASHPMKWNQSFRNFHLKSYLPIVNSVLRKYPEVPFYDFTLKHPNHDSLFSDANHLNQKGVDLFNEKLIEQLIKLDSNSVPFYRKPPDKSAK